MDVSIDGITATAKWCGAGMVGEYPNCYPVTSGTVTDTDADGTTDWSWEGGTGGTESDPDVKDGNDCPDCGERAPSATEKEKMKEVLPQIWCSDVRTRLDGMLAAGSVLVYTQENKRLGEWDSDTGIIYVNYAQHWHEDGTVSEHELADTLTHEAVHAALGHTNGMDSDFTHGPEFQDKMAECGFPQLITTPSP